MKKGIIFLGVLLIINFFSWSFLFYLQKEDTTVIFFDVGQGDAIFIRTAENHHILIDGGPGNTIIGKLEQEIPFFYKNIDLIILTHAHYDHVSGLLEVIDRYNVKDIVCTGAFGGQQVSQEWNKIIEEREYIQARAGMRISGNTFYIDILHPAEDLAGEMVGDLNAVSIMSRLVINDSYSFLFTGDAYAEQENEVLTRMDNCLQEENRKKEWCKSFVSLDSHVLDVGHHGSKTSTGNDFLSAVTPDIGVIMVGENNRYGHPHQEVLTRLQEHNIDIKRTDIDGDIIFNIK